LWLDNCVDAHSRRLKFSFKAYRRPFRLPLRTSKGIWDTREGIVISVSDAQGRIGLGEIAPISWFRTETLIGALAWCESLGHQVEPERLLQPDRGLLCCGAAAGCAMEALSACDEAAPTPGRGARLPVAALLPGGWPALDALDRAVERGHCIFKIKIGTGEWQAEQGLIERLVGRLPGGATLRLDANGGLDARAASRWLAAAEDWPVEFIEQPLPVEAREDLCRLAADHRVPVALDESVLTADDIKRWRDWGWPGVFVIKPALAGPRDELRAEILPDPAPFVFSSALETDIGLVGGVRLALDCGVTRALGYGTGAFFHDDGLGGSLSSAWFGPSELPTLDPQMVWKHI